jgi:hypothetical protein
MIHIRDEGEIIKTGFNFYPFKSSHFGFKFYINGKQSWQLRYSKPTGLLWIGQKSFQLKKASEK